MRIKRLVILSPVYWSIFIFIVAQALTFSVVTRENAFLENNQIYVPSQPSEAVTLWPQQTVSPSGEVTETLAQKSCNFVNESYSKTI